MAPYEIPDPYLGLPSGKFMVPHFCFDHLTFGCVSFFLLKVSECYGSCFLLEATSVSSIAEKGPPAFFSKLYQPEKTAFNAEPAFKTGFFFCCSRIQIENSDVREFYTVWSFCLAPP